MRTKLIHIILALLACTAVYADEVWNFNVYDDCSRNGYESGISPAPADVQAVDLDLPSGIKWASCNWSDGNTDNPRIVTVNTAMTLTAQFTSTSTTIDNTSAAAITPQKVLCNGQVLILRNAKTYTVTGIEVK